MPEVNRAIASILIDLLPDGRSRISSTCSGKPDASYVHMADAGVGKEVDGLLAELRERLGAISEEMLPAVPATIAEAKRAVLLARAKLLQLEAGCQVADEVVPREVERLQRSAISPVIERLFASGPVARALVQRSGSVGGLLARTSLSDPLVRL